MYKKIYRSIKRNIKLLMLCIILLSAGLAAIIGLLQSGQFLDDSFSKFCDECNYSDIFVSTDRISKTEYQQLANIDDVTAVTGNLYFNGKICDGNNNSMIMIGYDALADNKLNSPKIVNGRNVNGKGEIIINRGYCLYNNISIGDTINILYFGHESELRVVGIYVSPLILSAAAETKYNGKTGYAYIDFSSVDVINDLYYNQIYIGIDSNGNYDKITSDINSILSNCNNVRILEGSEYSTYKNLHNQISNLKVLGIGLSVIVGTIGLIIMIIVINRITVNDSKEIGILKSLGFGYGTLLRNYLFYGLFIGLTSSLLGIIFGYGLSVTVFMSYQKAMSLPDIMYFPNWILYAIVSIILVLFSIIFTALSCNKILKKEIYDILYVRRTSGFKKSLLERVKPLWNTMSVSFRYAIRNISRSKKRSVMVSIMLILIIILSVLGFGINDNNNYYINNYQKDVYNYDVKVEFDVPVSESYINSEFSDYNEIKDYQFYTETELQVGNYANDIYNVAILESDNYLYGVFDRDSNIVSIPDNGVIISEKLAEMLKLSEGDTIEIKEIDTGLVANIRISGVYYPIIESGIIMSYNAYREAFGAEKEIGALMILNDENVGSENIESLKRSLSDEEHISSVTDIDEMISMYNDNNKSSEMVFDIISYFCIIIAIIIFACIICINVSERQFELFMLRVIGLFPHQIGKMIVLELFITSIPSIIISIPVSYSILSWFLHNSVASTDKLMCSYIHISAMPGVYSMLGIIIGLLIAYLIAVGFSRKIIITNGMND